MNQILKTELKKYFKKINERKKYIERWLEKNKIKSRSDWVREYQDKVEKKLHMIAKEFMDRKGFDFEKGRNQQGDRIRFYNGYIKYIKWNHKTLYRIDFTSNYGNEMKKIREFLPVGFDEVVEKVKKKFERIDKLHPGFKGVINTNLKVDAISILDEVREEEVGKIELEDDKFNVDDQHLYYDSVFDWVLKLMDKYKKHKKKVKKGINYLMKDINKILNNDYNKILVSARLLENG